MKPAHIQWSIAVWGSAHAGMFLRYHLPSLLQLGNLPALSEIAPVKARIYTDAPTLEAIRPALLAAKLHFEGIEAEMLPPDTFPHPSFLMSRAQWKAAELAAKESAALCWTFPDTLVAADSYRHVVERVKEGYRACLWQGPTMREEAALPFDAGGSSWAEVPYRDLLAATLNGIHPLMAQRIEPGNIGWPSMLCRVDGERMSQRTFHPNPIYIWPRQYPKDWQDSLDGTYTGKSGLTWDECCRMTEPGFFWSEIAPDSKRERQGTARAWDDAALKAWALANGIPVWNQREFEMTYRFEA